MKKNRRKAGFSLIEMMCALLILVLITAAIGMSMDAGTRIYRESTFETDSAILAGILNSAMGDVLRYSVNVMNESELNAFHNSQVSVGLAQGVFKRPDDGNCYDEREFFTFRNDDYGMQNGYFYLAPHTSGKNMSIVQMKNLKNGKVVDLVNTGAYPDLLVSDLKLVYVPRAGTGVRGGYFEVSYTINSMSDETKTRDVSTIVRLMKG